MSIQQLNVNINILLIVQGNHQINPLEFDFHINFFKYVFAETLTINTIITVILI